MTIGDRGRDVASARLRDLAFAQVDASVVITDRDGRIVEWNDGATRLFGWTPDEALGATWEDLAGPVAADPDPRRALVRRQLEAAASYTGELTVATKSGERIPILVSGGPIRDEDGQVVGAIGIAIDDRRRELAEERFEVAFREAPVASVMTTGERQLILDVNPAFEFLSGYKRHEVIGRTSDELGLWGDPDMSDAVLLEKLAAAAEKLKAKRGELSGLQSLNESIASWGANRARLAAVVESEQAGVKSLESLRAEERELSPQVTAVAAEESRLSRQIAEVDKSQSELRNLLSKFQAHVRTGTCPLCGEDHGTKDELVRRIQKHVAADAASERCTSPSRKGRGRSSGTCAPSATTWDPSWRTADCRSSAPVPRGTASRRTCWRSSAG